MIHLTIRQQLLFVTILPIIGLLFLSYNIITTSSQERQKLFEIDTYLNYTIITSKLINKLQIERRLNLAYIENNDLFLKKAIIEKQKKIDETAEQIKRLLQNKSIQNSKNIAILLGQINNHKFNQNKKTVNYYNRLISQIINTTEYIQTLATTDKLSQYSTNYINILRIKENSAQLRAIITKIISSNKIENAQVQQILILISKQKRIIHSFQNSSSKKTHKIYTEKINTKNSQDIQDIQEMIITNHQKFNIISEMKSITGYGGLIHNFKNYLLRKDTKYQVLFQENYKKLLIQISKYEKLPITKEERKHLENIINTFTMYKNNLKTIATYSNLNQSIDVTDKKIQIDDTKAFKSFQILSTSLVGLDIDKWLKMVTIRMNELNTIEKTLLLGLSKEIQVQKTFITNEVALQLVFISIFLLLVIFLSIHIYQSITNKIYIFQEGLLSFFKYINKDSRTYTLLHDERSDEFGNMAKVLNKSISQIASHIQEEVSIAKEQEIRLFEANKMATLGEMIGNIAHQWRQPLSVISTAASGMTLQKEFGLLDDDTFYKSCKAIDINAQYLSNTINDFQNFIKGNSEITVFNLKENINSFLTLVEGTIKKDNINIITNYEDDITIKSYANELIQCYLNIFNNAKDALKDIGLEQKLIFISSKKVNNDVIVNIKDNAGGISDEIIQKIFDPYFTTKHKSQGTGLGLHMTYNLITKGMNGSINVKNDEYTYQDNTYKGASFTIILPIS